MCSMLCVKQFYNNLSHTPLLDFSVQFILLFTLTFVLRVYLNASAVTTIFMFYYFIPLSAVFAVCDHGYALLHSMLFNIYLCVCVHVCESIWTPTGGGFLSGEAKNDDKVVNFCHTIVQINQHIIRQFGVYCYTKLHG